MQSHPVKDRGYAHPELLAETEWLAHWIHHPKLRVIDARQPSEYLLAHLPGAINISGFGGIPRAENGDMAEPEEFSRLASCCTRMGYTKVWAYLGNLCLLKF